MMRESMAMTDVILKERVKDNNGWTSFDECLPKLNQKVIVYCNGFFGMVVLRQKGNGRPRLHDGSRYSEINTNAYWRPLPEPPQQEVQK